MSFRRIALALVAATALGSALIHAQIPGRNVNMVSGTKLIDGDPFLQRQNEPSVAASTRNPLHLLAGANDYRTVDLPGLPNSEETGDAWLGLFKSVDGGQRWTSTLIPGYPQDPLRNDSPLKLYGAAADPVVRAGTNGFIYYAGLAFNRGTNAASAVFVSRFIDDNNRERRDPFSFIGTSIVSSDTGVTGRFLDKPWIAVDIPRDSRTCPVTTTIIKPPATLGGTSTTVTETHNLPAGPVYVAYAAFTGSGTTLKSDIMFTYSVNCGVSWSTPVRLSAADGSINQGATIAIEPNTGAVTVAWRRFTRPGAISTDAIMVSQSLLLGRTFGNPLAVRKLPRLKSLIRLLDTILEHRRQQGGVAIEELTEFDQPTAPSGNLPSAQQFRTNTYPTMAWDDRGRLYVAWSERGFSTAPGRGDPLLGDAKIVMASALLGLAWSAPKAVSETGALGHQFMPSLAFAGGKLLLVYYDLREDVSQVQGDFIDDIKAGVSSGKRHTLDIRASLGTPGTLIPVFAPSVRVSDYFIGHRPVPNPQNFIPCPADPLQTDCEQLQYNPPNLPMFKQGTVPFFGDYIDISPAPAFVPAGRSGWAYNTSRSSVPVFHAVWTDNRDVRKPANNDWTKYTPPNQEGETSHVSPIDGSTVACDPAGDTIGSRNQNVYTARITGGLLVGSPGNTKPLSQALQRGFVVFAQNMTNVYKTFRMQVVPQANVIASFQQIFTQPVTFVDVVVPPRSTASRTLYVKSSDPHARVTVNVFEITTPGNGTPATNGLTGIVILNADIENADIENADIENADIENADIENAELISADIENPSFAAADIENADIENADIENADIENADIENADIENADIENADIENTPFADAPKTDLTWGVTNTSNTTAAFNVNLFLSQNAPTSGVKTQLILHKAYLTPAAANCDLKLRSHTVLVTNITNPTFVTPTGTIPDPNNPDSNNATLSLAPGEKGYITLRLHDIDPSNNVLISNKKGQLISVDAAFVPGVTLAPIVVAQEIGTADLAAGVTKPPITTLDDSTIFFVTPPANSLAGAVMSRVSVQVRNKSGAVVPGVNVTLSLLLGHDPTEVPLNGTLTLTTGTDGIARFDTLQINTPNQGYRLRATPSGANATGILPTDSLPFDVTTLQAFNFVVQNTNDSGPGSLRAAIAASNANAGARDVITFAIPAGQPRTIQLLASLPGLNDSVTIDATPGGVCTGAAPTVEITADPSGTAKFTHGLFAAARATIRGLSITGFNSTAAAGIFVSSSGSGSTIECNYIGLAPDGVTVKPNGYGIRIGFAANTVGGTTAEARNVISGNLGNGILIQGPTPDSTGGFQIQNVVQGNYIGTDPSGTQDVGNGGDGIQITNAQLNTIANNVVSGNAGEGIRIDGFRSINNTIQGNRVGTNAAGTGALGNDSSGIYARRAGQNSIIQNVVSGNHGFAGIAICGTPTFCGGGGDVGLSSDAAGNAIRLNIVGLDTSGRNALGNAGYGISLDGAPNTLVGAPGGGNLISANGAAGIVIFGTGADGNVIQGNHIGTDSTFLAPPTASVDDATPLNNGAGVEIAAGSNNIVSGVDSNGDATRNVIAFNSGPGISVTNGTGNMFRLNIIRENGGLGIDLGPTGVTPNDPNDVDSGPNDLQNAPVLTTAQVTTTTLSVQGSLNSTPFTRFTVDLYAGVCDSGNRQGISRFDRFIVDTNSDGNVPFNRLLQGSDGFAPVSPGSILTAVVTPGDFVTGDATTGSTSEFSNCVLITEASSAAPATDASGDATPSGGTIPSPDLVSTTVVNTGTALVFQVRFAAGTFDQATTNAQLLLDTDRNPSTGHPGTDSICGNNADDNGIIGSEFIVNASGPDGVTVLQYAGQCNVFVPVDVDPNNPPALNVVANGYDITVPLPAIASEGGLLNYKVVSFLPTTAPLDVMPDVGQPAATTVGGGIIP